MLKIKGRQALPHPGRDDHTYFPEVRADGTPFPGAAEPATVALRRRKGVGSGWSGHPHLLPLDADVLQLVRPVGQAGWGGEQPPMDGTPPHGVAARQKVQLFLQVLQTHGGWLGCRRLLSLSASRD